MPRLLVLLALAVVVGCFQPSPQAFDDRSVDGEPPVAVSTNGVSDEDAALVKSRDGGFRVVWSSKRQGPAHLYTATSADGTAWVDEQVITSDANDDFYPALLQTRDGTLHLTWFRIDQRTGRRDVWYASSPDGRAWTSPARISTAGMDWAPAIYEDAFPMLWIVWSSGRSGNRELYAVRSGDGGRRWSEDFRLTQSPEQDDFPSVLVRRDGERLLTWTRYSAGSKLEDYYRDESAEVVVATSRDGLRWSPPITWSPPDPNDRYVDFLPCLFRDAAGARTFLAWTSSRTQTNGEILARELSVPSSPIWQLTNSPVNDYDARIVPAGNTPGTYLMTWTSGRKGTTHIVARTIALP